MAPGSRFERWLGLGDGEGGRAGRLLAMVFTFSLGLALAKAAQSAIFLAAYERSAIPWAFACSAVLLATASLSAVALAPRLGPIRLATRTLLVSAGTLVALRAALAAGVPGAAFGVYVAIEAIAGSLLIQIWSVVAEATDARSAKRLVPMAGVGASAAWALGGLGVKPLVPWVGGPAGLLLLAPCLLAASAALVRLVGRRDAARAKTRPATRVRDEWSRGFAFVRSVPLMRLTAGLSMAALVTEQLMDFQMMAVVRERFADPSATASFFGAYYGLTSVASVVVLFGMSGRLVAWLGASRSLFLVPALTAGAALVAVLVPAFPEVVALRATDRVLKTTLWSTANEQTQTPLPTLRRAQARALVRGVLAPGAYALAALGLALLPDHIDLRFASLACFGATAAMAAVVATRVRAAYEEALKQAIDDRRLDLEGALARGALDPDACGALGAALASSDEEGACVAVELLAAGGIPLAARTLHVGLAHPSALVRQRTVEALSRLGVHDATAELARVATTDRHAEVRRLAARALRGVPELAGRVASTHEAASTALRAVEGDADPRVRAAARASLATLAERREGLRALATMLSSPEEADVEEALEALPLSAAEHQGVVDRLAALLEPEVAPTLRRAALAAAARLRPRSLVGTVIALLDDPRLGADAAERLSEWGEEALQALVPALEHASSMAASRVASALAEASSAHAGGKLLAHADPAVRERASRALGLLIQRKGRPPMDRSAIEPLLQRELAHAYQLTSLLAGIARDDGSDDWGIDAPFEFVAGEIDLRRRAARRRVLHLLGLLESRDVVRTVEFGLRQQRVGLDAKVAELLELWLPPDLRPAIMPLFDRLTLREQAAAAERLGYLVQASVDDPLTALLALGDAHLLGAAMVSYEARFAERLPQVYDDLRPMLPLFERMMFLRRVPLFAELSGEDLRGIAEIVDELDVEAGTTLCRKGEPGEEMYVVLSGRVSIRDGKTELAVLGEREIVGELAVLDHDARLADVVCIDDTRLLRLRGADLSELMARRPQISEQVLLVVVRRLRTVTQRLSQ